MQALERRITHKYRAGWASLDDHEYIGTTNIICNVSVNDGDGGWASTNLIAVNTIEPLPFKVIEEAIRDTFGGTNCRHEHDCCGCITRYVSDVEYTSGGNFTFECHAVPNY